MKLIIIVIACVTLGYAITVPPTWGEDGDENIGLDEPGKNLNRYKDDVRILNERTLTVDRPVLGTTGWAPLARKPSKKRYRQKKIQKTRYRKPWYLRGKYTKRRNKKTDRGRTTTPETAEVDDLNSRPAIKVDLTQRPPQEVIRNPNVLKELKQQGDQRAYQEVDDDEDHERYVIKGVNILLKDYRDKSPIPEDDDATTITPEDDDREGDGEDGDEEEDEEPDDEESGGKQTEDEESGDEESRDEESGDEEVEDDDKEGEATTGTKGKKAKYTQDDESEESPHEKPPEVPTRPIYPGEGKWAIKGLKHRPHISPHPFATFRDDKREKIEEKPPQYETFEDGEKLFNKYSNQFKSFFDDEFPKQATFSHPLLHNKARPVAKPSKDNDGQHTSNKEEDYEEDESDFVPTQVYSQIRRSENEEHLPVEAAPEPRLREVIKDSKIQTVYTEEGYEDTAYDHAGHEKNAESDHGYSEFDQNEQEEKEKKVPRFLLKSPSEQYVTKIKTDQDRSESQVKEVKSPMKVKNNFVKTKRTKTMTLKDVNSGDKELEVRTKLETILEPNNARKAQKFVEIIPKLNNEALFGKLKNSTGTRTQFKAINRTQSGDSSGSIALPDQFNAHKGSEFNLDSSQGATKMYSSKFNLPRASSAHDGLRFTTTDAKAPQLLNIESNASSGSSANISPGAKDVGGGLNIAKDDEKTLQVSTKVHNASRSLRSSGTRDNKPQESKRVETVSTSRLPSNQSSSSSTDSSTFETSKLSDKILKPRHLSSSRRKRRFAMNQGLSTETIFKSEYHYNGDKLSGTDNAGNHKIEENSVGIPVHDATQNYREKNLENRKDLPSLIKLNELIVQKPRMKPNSEMMKSNDFYSRNKYNKADAKLTQSPLKEDKKASELQEKETLIHAAANMKRTGDRRFVVDFPKIRYTKPKPQAAKAFPRKAVNVPELQNEKNYAKTSERTQKIAPNFRNLNPEGKFTQSSSIDQTDGKTRKRRFTIDFPKIEVDTDFIDNLQTDLPFVKPKVENLAKKYPYYNLNFDQLHKLSPLRYAEDLTNAPQKTEGEMTFYEEASRKLFCPEVETDIDPIPDRVKNAEQRAKSGEEAEDVDLPELPRLKGLGDKIDCFKRRYFGENPLDSPLFREQLVEPVESLFQDEFPIGAQKAQSKPKVGWRPIEGPRVIVKAPKELERQRSGIKEQRLSGYSRNQEIDSKKDSNKKKYSSRFSASKLLDKLRKEQKLMDVAKHDENLVEDVTTLPPDIEVVDVNQLKHTTTEAASISLVTTPNYTLPLKPKHIYDQIVLLDHLPGYEELPYVNETKTNGNDSQNQGNSRKPKIFLEDLEGSTEIVEDRNDGEELPEKQALRKKKRRRPRPHKPNYRVFNVNRLLSSTPYPYLNYAQPTVLPKYKIVSEVHYKDEIKPNEQLTVFTDVINNIKNSSRDPLIMTSNRFFQDGGTRSKKIGLRDVQHSNVFNHLEPLTTTTLKPLRGATKYHPDVQDEEVLIQLQENSGEYGKKKRPSSTLRGSNEDNDLSETKIQFTSPKTVKAHPKTPQIQDHKIEQVDYLDDPNEEVLGLVPPSGNWDYKTIYDSDTNQLASPSYGVVDENQINQYFVPGMRPPSSKQKVYSYDNFKSVRRNQTRKRQTPSRKYKRRIPTYVRRVKRSANRPSYSAVRRGSEHTTEKPEEEDDYVPHRPKNYHYDEKTGRIVYDKTTPPPQEEVIYVEEVEEPVSYKPSRRGTTTTTKPDGPSYVDYINLVKAQPNYVAIPDPTTTEKSKEATSTTTTTSTSSGPKQVPEFLSILSTIKSDNRYKPIADKNATKDMKMASTETVEVVTPVTEEDTEEAGSIQIQNSPGANFLKPNNKFQIFDVNEYLPKVRTYVPRTSINLSKYKTIQRSTVTNPVTIESSTSVVNGEAATEESTPQLRVKHIDQIAQSDSNHSRSKQEAITEQPQVSSTLTPSTTTVKMMRSTTQAPSTTKRQRLRTRRPSSRHTTKQPVKSTTTAASFPIDQEKPKRVYPKRNPSRIRLRTTTDKQIILDADNTTKILRRRHQTETNINRRKDPYSRNLEQEPIIVPEEVIESAVKEEEEEETTTAAASAETQTTAELIHSKKLADVEVFNKFDPEKKHGGNYKSEADYEAERAEKVPHRKEKRRLRYTTQEPYTNQQLYTNQQSYKSQQHTTQQPQVRLSDVVPKPDAFYMDTRLPKNINQLKVVEVTERVFDYDTQAPEDNEDLSGDYYDEIKIVFPTTQSSTTSRITTKLPVVIKDPDKRMYFYVRN